MRFFSNENEARVFIADIIRPIFSTADLFIAERNPQNIGLRDVLFAAKVKRDEQKADRLVNAFYQKQILYSEALEWQGSKTDFLNDLEHEYFMIKAVIENG